MFGGYRGWTTYPAGLIGSSVAQYAFFVPPEEWPVRQQLMNGADDLLDTAERFGAGWVVPYADGGAPWHGPSGSDHASTATVSRTRPSIRSRNGWWRPPRAGS